MPLEGYDLLRQRLWLGMGIATVPLEVTIKTDPVAVRSFGHPRGARIFSLEDMLRG